MNIRRLLTHTLLATLCCLTTALAEPSATKIAIIKADDVRSPHAKWERFIQVSQQRNVKVSIGLIGNSLEKNDPTYHQWLNQWLKTGQVEFWHHGWDHKTWEIDGKKFHEFGGSGYDHQKNHLLKTQNAIKPIIGKPFITFGSPNNAMDEDTTRALNEMSELRLIFVYPTRPVIQHLKNKTLLPMMLRGEHDGTGKPNFDKFKQEYLSKKSSTPVFTLTALQFHPMGFSDEGFKHYTDILDFLLSEGWTFMLPEEYLAQSGSHD